MRAQLFLITPPDIGVEFAQTLENALDGNDVAALLIQRGSRETNSYLELANTLIPIAQKANCAVLLDNMPDAVNQTGADGVHMTGSPQSIAEVVEQLKPNFIVGAGGIHSRHDAMTKGELGVDYVFFGHLAAQKSDDDHTAEEFANWWAQTFEVPAVGFDANSNTMKVLFEFRAVRDQIWQSDNPKAAIAAVLGA